MKPVQAIQLIDAQFDSLGYTEEEWSFKPYSKLWKTMKRVREIVKETKQ